MEVRPATSVAARKDRGEGDGAEFVGDLNPSQVVLAGEVVEGISAFSIAMP